MRLTWDDLTVSPKGVDFNELLSEWRWLVDGTYGPVLLTALGDLFLRSADGSVHWLDTGAGRLTPAARNLEEFQSRMQQREHADRWFLPQLVADLKTAGVQLAAGQCYGWRVPPVLGGKIEPANVEPTDLSVHFGTLGQVHRQVKDLPAGTPIGEIRFR